MKKATKKLFKKSSAGINGHSSFSSAAASALSLSPVVEDEDEQELHRAFYDDVDGRVGDCLRGAHNNTAYDDDTYHSAANVPDDDTYANKEDVGPQRSYDHGTVRKHPHEVDSEVSARSLRGYDDANRRRAQQQQRQLDKWSKQKHSSKSHTRHDSLESPGDHASHSREEHRRWKSAPAPPFPDSNSYDYDNDDSNYGDYNSYDEDNNNEAALKASSKQKRTIETYVQRVIANADSDEYVTPLPRMDSDYSQQSQSSHQDSLNNSSQHSSNKDNLLPLPGFGEVDLLQRAIERRALLHDRIVKMEEASAQFAREEEERSERYQQRQQQKQRNHREQRHNHHSGKERKRRSTVEETDDDRMNEISQRIKAEALEFLNHSFDEDNTSSAQEDNLTQDSSCETKECSDEENEGSTSKLDPPEEIGETDGGGPGRRQLSDQQSAGSGSMGENVEPTTQQLARYSNMVRLGIPDMAVLRSMDRDGIDSSRASSLLENLKQQHAKEARLANAPSDELSDTGKTPKNEADPSASSPSSLRSLVTEMAKSPKQTTKMSSRPPLKDDPDYNKYFKMLKAKVPLSWVKRVLEVDGKDARVLDLDPDVPLQRQIALDENGNIDWDKVVRFRSGSDSSGDELMGKSPNKRPGGASSKTSKIQLETNDRVKAELSIMTAKAGRLSRESSRQSSLSDSCTDAREIKPNPADISSAAAAASNARLIRLKAMTSPDRGMRRKQSVDEIRRRPPPPPPRPKPNTPQHTPQNVPPSPSPSSTASERAVTARRQTYEHLPLKDDPRFSKYFQMIRSRVPRSWVERVIEVDDRDPAILDLDPNKPLAAQVDDDEMKSVVKTLGTSDTDGSLDESMRSGAVSRSSEVNFVKNDSVLPLTPTEEVPSEETPPITQIVNAVDDERSIASSITNFKDGTGSQAEQSNPVLDRISAFLDKIEARSRNSAQAAVSSAEEQTPPETREDKHSKQLTSPEDIENKLTSLIERFDSRGSQVQSENEAKEATFNDKQQQFLAENQSDITKLTSLLASKLGQQPDGISASNETSDLAKLSNLLTEVLTKMDVSTTTENEEQETPDSSTPKKLGKNAALEALFAKRAALSEEQGAPILREDPEYEKYFKMQKVGMPRPVIEQALERDGKDISILDLDPDKPLADQQKEKEAKPNKNAALEALFANRSAALQPSKKDDVLLKNDPEYQKYFKMLKVGMPRDAVVQALERDGKSGSILDLDPEEPYASQMAKESGDNVEMKSDVPIKDNPEYAKFFKMLKMGIPLGAVEQALQKEGKDRSIASMDPNKSYASQIKEKENESSSKADDVPLKDHPEYAKFFKMLKMGIPLPAVKQALVKEGKDPSIIDMDPDKPFAKEVLLKDDPEYSKFFQMLKMGVPPPAVKQALQKEGKDPNIIDLDPEKPLSKQQSKQKVSEKPAKAKAGPKVARKRLHWNKIDESKLNEKSFWNQAKDEHASLQLVGLDIDNEEFASLFTSQVNKSAAPKKDPVADTKKSPGKQKVQLIDGRRRMNGSILLTKFKVDYKLLAKQVDNMEYVEAEGNELRGMMQLLPTKDESLALRSYLPPADAPQSEIDDAIDKLGECEQYMAVMLDVPDAKEKFQCMLFRAEFEQQVDSIRDGTKLLIDACDSVQNSERFKKLLMYALKLGNALNTDGSGAEATAITLDSLLKLAEAKAFDRQTSVLHYLVSIVSKNDEDVLKLSEDFIPVKAAERVAVDMLSQQLKELTNGIELIKDMAKKYAPQNETVDGEVEDEIPEDELLGATPMGKFSLSAESKITSLTTEFAEAKVNFADLLEFFGEDANLTPEAFFCTINTFVSMFDQTYKELKRKEEAKERKKRIEEKRKLREEATRQAKANS